MSKSYEVEVINKLGLHARAAAKLVKLAAGFESRIRLGYRGQVVDAKSIMGIMMLAAAQGARIEVDIEGADAEAAAGQIERLFANRFGEEE